MKKWLMIALFLFVISAYASTTAFNNFNSPLFCADCHPDEYNNYVSPIPDSDMPAHKDKQITCIQCHSPSGPDGDLTAKKFFLNLMILNQTSPLINGSSLLNFSILKTDCAKCHILKKINVASYNHSNTSDCENCHLMHNKSTKLELSFLKHMGEGGHKNLACGDCHGTDISRLNDLPQCTKCHTTHLKGAQWDRSTCLGCHDNPHNPTRNPVFKANISKEICAACHEKVYQTLTAYDSKHNGLPYCTDCHPKHGEKKTCISCHTIKHGVLHPDSKCSSCHGYINRCTDCHLDPHAPMKDLPNIKGQKQLQDYAKYAGKRTRA